MEKDLRRVTFCLTQFPNEVLMDPLSLLRDFNCKGQIDHVKVDEAKGLVHFGETYSFPKSSFTNFKSRAGLGEFYTLDAVLLLLRSRNDVGGYIRQTTRNKVMMISGVDRKNLLDYLDGIVEASSIPQVVEAPTLAPLPAIVPEDDALEPASKRARLEVEEEPSTMKALLSLERQLRTRNNLLVAPNKDFSKVLEIVKRADIAIKEAAEKARKVETARLQKDSQHHQRPTQPVHSRPTHVPNTHQQPNGHKQMPSRERPPDTVHKTAVPVVKPSGRFDRDTTKEQVKAIVGEGAENLASAISMYGYNSQTAPRLQSSAAPSAAGPALQSTSHRPSSHTPVKPSTSGHRPHSSAHKSSSSQPKSDSSRYPIIIVPSGMSAMMNMFNAPQFLEHGEFVTVEMARSQGVIKKSSTTICRVAGRESPVKYLVTDKAPTSSSDWSRVVAVIVQGANWQFKEWPFKGVAKGDVVELFSRHLGVFFSFHGEAIPPLVKTWNVKTLSINKVQRHLDKSTQLEFFKLLDTFWKSKKIDVKY